MIPGSKHTVMVVDDTETNVDILVEALGEEYDISVATDGASCIEAVSASVPDLILLDVMMPEMDGFEVCRKLKASAETAEIPVIFLTALRDIKEKQRGFELGAVDYVTKPFELGEVKARVKNHLALKEAQQLLKDQNVILDKTVEQRTKELSLTHNLMSEGIVLCDSEWRIRDLNPVARRYLNTDQIGSANLITLLQKEYSTPVDADTLTDVAVTHKVFDLIREESERVDALYLETNVNVIRDKTDVVSSIVVVLRDVTVQRREQRLKQDFLSLISHKLRTPVTVVLGNAYLLAEGVAGTLSDQQAELSRAILEKSQELGELIEKLLAFTTITSETVTAVDESTVLVDRFNEAVQTQTKGAGKPVSARALCSEEARVSVSQEHLDLMLANLVENAVKFCNKDTVSIVLRVVEKGEWLDLSISDNGPGISPEHQERIFEAFYQIEKHFTGNVQGIGLGLPLVKHLVNAYGGRITLSSKQDHGTTFSFRLPRSKKIH